MKKFLALVLAMAFATPVLAADKKPKATPEDMFKKLDTNSDGKIDLTEFKGKKEGDKAAAAEKQFKARDKNSDGFITLDEFKGGRKAK